MKQLASLFICVLLAVQAPTLVAQDQIGYFGTTNGHEKPTWIVQELPQPTFSLSDVRTAPAPQQSARTADEKIHPDLHRILRSERSDSLIRLVVEFPEDLPMPAFPTRDRTKSIDDPANMAVITKRNAVSESFLAQRLERSLQRDAKLAASGIRIIERFWITNSLVVEMRLSGVGDLANRSDVLSIQPVHTSVGPPTIQGGRQVLTSDYIASYTWNHSNYVLIGLLDTGTALTAQNTVMHTLFNPPNQIGGLDCVNGTNTDCTVGWALNPADDCWNHGIPSTGILTANNSLGDTYRGVTNFTVRSYKVYDQNGSGSGCTQSGGQNLGLNTAAAQRAFQAAINSSMDVIVVEIQDWKGSVLTAAADNAFDAGSAVIAAAGNYGASGANSIASPGEAHKAIAVGAVDYSTLTQQTYQSLGPETDGRIKPDIQGPTNTETASNTGYSSVLSFGGTSGSTPYAGASAALLSSWLSPYGVAPGHIYAQLIHWGRNFTNPTTNNTAGAGLLALQPGPEQWLGYGVVTVGNGQTVEIPQWAWSPTQDLRAAIWWPESTTLHNNIDLRLVDPSGTIVATSSSVNSVFEKVEYPGSLSYGLWKIRITGATVTGTQDVYYTYSAK